MTQSPRLLSYARIATAPCVAMAAGQASAGLQIWTVGQALPQVNSAGSPASMDLQVVATFNSAFKINFFGTVAFGDDQVFWAPSNNLQFINNSDSESDPAIWRNSVLIGADALNGVASNVGSTIHAWYGATTVHQTYHDINSNISAGETGAFGIRFVSGADYYYGWVEVSEDANGIITVERWALENTANTAAQYSGSGGAPAVPGLGGLAALAMGAGGVRRKRSRVA